MIYSRGLEPGTVKENIRVDRIVRGNPLTYACTCLRKDCGGTFMLLHDRIVSLPMGGFCAWPGCQPEKSRSRPEPMRVNVYGFDNARQIEGQEAFNLRVIRRVSELSPTLRYEVQCRLCNAKWIETRKDLLALTGYKCRNVTCRLEYQRALHNAEKRSRQRADGALAVHGGDL